MRALAVAFLILLGSSAGWAQTLRWATQGDLQTLDPHSQNEGLTNNLNAQVYEALVYFDDQMNVAPGLATEWTQVTPTLWRVKLRPNVRFHDGTPFTSDDVVFSIKRAQQPSSPFRTYATSLGNPRAVDDLTVEFQLPQVDPLWPSHAGTVLIMSRKWSEAHRAGSPLDFKNKEEKYTHMNENGTGPYILVSR